MLTRSASCQRHAFTFIELLIVIALIGILSATLVPAGLAVRRAAVRVACSCNLRQLGAILFLYADENEGKVPADGNLGDDDPATSPAWFYRLPPLLGSRTVRAKATIFQCAGFHWHGPHVFTNATPKSFKMNTYLDSDGRPKNYRFGSVSDEGELVLFVDAEAGETGVGQWGDCPATAVDDSRHRGAVNVLYADGHSRAVIATPPGTDRRRWQTALTWRSADW